VIRPSGPTTERAPPWPRLCSLVFEVPPLFSQPLSSLSLAFRRGLYLSVCFVCETTGHGTSTTFRGRRVDPAALARVGPSCVLLQAAVLRCGVAGR